MRERPNARRYPRLRPVIAQRFFNRTGEEFLGSIWSAAKSPDAFKAARFAAYFFTSFSFFAYLASWDFLATEKIKLRRAYGKNISVLCPSQR